MKRKRKTSDPEREKAIKALSAVAESLGFKLDELVPPSESTANQDELLTIKQVARLLNVSPFTVRRRIDDGCFEAIKLHPGHNGSIRISRKSVQSWLGSKEKDNYNV